MARRLATLRRSVAEHGRAKPGRTRDERDRRLIAEQLRGGLGAGQLPDDPEWRAEFDRRLQAVADGTAELNPWEQARDEIRAELARRRAARTPSEPT